jgi:hypothetical protein
MYPDDNIKYDFSTSKGDYKREFDITDNQLETLKRFGDKPDLTEFGFDMDYNGIDNSCIDFTYKALDIIDFVPEGYDGDIWPTLNIDNIRAIPSSNASDDQLFISKEGGLFILDNQNQMTVKLFAPSEEVNSNKTNSLAIDALKLGSNKISIKDSSNQDIADFSVKEGDHTGVFNNSLLLKEEAKFFNKNGEEVSPSNAIIKFEDTNLGELTLLRTDVSTTLADNTTTTLNSLINTIETSSKAFDNFTNAGVSTITKKLFGVEANVSGLLAEISLALATGQNLEEVATKIAIREVLISPAFDRIAMELNDAFTDQAEIELLRNELLSSDSGSEQLEILTQKLGSEADALQLIDFQNLQSSQVFQSVKGAIIQFAVISSIDAIDGGDKMNSEQYAEVATQIIAQQAVTLGVSHYFGTKATLLTPASISPVGFGVGVGVGHLVSAGVSDLFADDKMNSHQWKSTTMTAAAMGATAGAIGGAAVAMGLIQASALLGPVGFAIGVLAAVIVTQVFGGKEYKAGEYPDPYSYLRIEAKEDGTGNKIIGIEPEGVVAIAREYYHDDLYGTSGSDNLIGKSGTNTIYGYTKEMTKDAGMRSIPSILQLAQLKNKKNCEYHIEGRSDVKIIKNIANDNSSKTSQLLNRKNNQKNKKIIQI